MLEIKNKRQCCGCQVCAQICPVDAIVMKTDEEGFKYPEVILDLCVNCSLCEKVCPVHSDYINETADPCIYAAINKNNKVCKKSSSGGVFTAISNWFLQRHGKVYGVEFDEDFKVRHNVAECAEERNYFRGSKYVQSDTERIYQQVEVDLKGEHLVLFTGTPCQVEALKRYLSLKKVDDTNLYTVDNICHGVASPKLWEEYVQQLQSYLQVGEKIEYIGMRSKNAAWRAQEMELKTNRRNISRFVNHRFSWNRLFLSLYVLRPSCFECRFTSYKRSSDLTLADFWNFENAGISLDDTDGVSLVLVNSLKGQELFQQIKGQLKTAQSDKRKCWQIHLAFPNNPPAKREKFWKDFKEIGVEKTLRKYTKGSLMNRMIRLVSPVLRKLRIYTWVAQLHHKISKR